MRSGTHVGPYQVLSLLGAGGMGEVYRARDTRLGRDVAIKVLPAEFAADAERLKRFEREAKATAALSHPNILDVHDVGTHEGVPYLVEELLEGESLRDRLARGPMPVREAVGIAVQVAHGLAAAHGKHIVHRDLKPANVFITKEGIVKILDFGIAKLVESVPLGEADTLTHAPTGATDLGRVLGTVAYMAPEQARGIPVDPRSDIFSFGVVLYEMLAGQRPFRGETATDTVAAILKEEPAPLPEGVPPALQGVLTQCLAKRPDQRFSSAHDLALALQAASSLGEAARSAVAGGTAPGLARQRRVVWLALAGVAVLAAAGVLVLKLRPAGPSARAAGPPKIVVLPFENLGSQEDAYFAAGMAEEITSRLANVQGLGVISRTSAMEYARRGKTVKEIGGELDVDYVLEGSVRWDRGAGRESRVRITPQLIRVADDTHVWADRYDRVIADVFAIQSEVAENAVKAMGVALLPHERTALKEISTNDLQAYDLYLRGREQARGVQVIPRVTGALQLYQAAVDRDPRFAQAVAGLAESHLSMYQFYVDRSPERLIRAREAAARAVELRPDLPETHTALGWYFYIGLVDYQRALGESSAALKIQPKDSDALALSGYVLRRQGRWAEAADALVKALELDPKNAGVLMNLGVTCVAARRYAEGDAALGRAIALDPQSGTQGDRADLRIVWHGDLERAQALVDEARNVVGPHENPHLDWAELRLALARRDYARVIRGVEVWPRSAFDNQWWYRPISLLRGEIQMMAGQQDLAQRSFEAARLELEQTAAQSPDDSRFHSSLGIAYAGLGRRDDAVREAKLGCELMLASKDAWRALWRVKDLALVYTMVGQAGEAIVQLEYLLAGSGEFTPHLLRLEPQWDPLRSDPRFQALLTKYEVKP